MGGKQFSGANYDTELVDDFTGDGPSTVTLIDRGPWDRHLTITNDVEQVLSNLLSSGVLGLKKDRRVFYIDSAGNTDEIVHDRGKFVRFMPGPGRRSDA